jgi:hypothetical protein
VHFNDHISGHVDASTWCLEHSAFPSVKHAGVQLVGSTTCTIMLEDLKKAPFNLVVDDNICCGVETYNTMCGSGDMHICGPKFPANPDKPPDRPNIILKHHTCAVKTVQCIPTVLHGMNMGYVFTSRKVASHAAHNPEKFTN